MSLDLSQVRMCVQKPLDREEHVHGQMAGKAEDQFHYTRLLAAFQKDKIWSNDITEITVQFCDPSKYTVDGKHYPANQPLSWTPIPAFGPLEKQDPLTKELHGRTDYPEIVKKLYISRYQPILPFKIRFVESMGNVRISFVPNVGSWSLVGTDCLSSDPNTVTLNYGWMDIPTILHEFGHVLGMIHEHQNPRGQTIEWNEPVLYEWARQTQGWDKNITYSNIIQKYSMNTINGSDFDSKSIMLYFFPGTLCVTGQGAIDSRTRPPCQSGEHDVKMTKSGVGTSENPILSDTDIAWIKKIYPSDSKITTYTKLVKKTEGSDDGGSGGNNGGGNDEPKVPKKTSGNQMSGKMKILMGVIGVSLIVLVLWYFLYKKGKK